MDKILFLDFDGVITTEKSRYNLDKECCNKIQKIVDATGCKIVISSNWRWGSLEQTMQYLESEFKCKDGKVPFWPKWFDDIIGVTERIYTQEEKPHHVVRGYEIYRWMHDQDIKPVYCILDDDSDMLLWQKDNFVQTDSYIGLTDKEMNLVIEILNRHDTAANEI